MEKHESAEFDLRNRLYQLEIGDDDHKQPIWVKRLSNILNSDIHKKPLGCKINDTHIRIGDIHLESFYEARILFSHSRWVRYFTQWLKQCIIAEINQRREWSENETNIFLIGYETYMEHILFSLKHDLELELEKMGDHSIESEHREWAVRYGVYEEPKYLQSTGDQISSIRIRYIERDYLERGDGQLNDDNTMIFVICGVSSTLSTFHKIDNQVLEDNKIEHKRSGLTKKCLSHYALIQVLPSNPSYAGSTYQWRFAQDDSTLEWNGSVVPDKISTITAYNKKGAVDEWRITAKYLVSVNCVWHNANDCKLCFPGVREEYDPLKEKPIIETSETSMVPIQMIQLDKEYEENLVGQSILSRKQEVKEYTVDFFAFEKKDRYHFEYKYKDYLYSGHIGRKDNHFKYYIRTGSLFMKILEDNKKDHVFDNYCQSIRRVIFDRHDKSEDPKTVDIIISTTDFSDNAFACAINNKVFGNRAHMISLDPKKEFRSNFETKYSNISYFLEQAKARNGKDDIDIRFFYIEDQIIIGDAFYRTKSLIRSLMSDDKSVLPSNVKLFEAVIVMLSRNSKGSQSDYVCDRNKFFPLITISVPSVRSYADSCPLCKLQSEALTIAKNSSLSYTENFWREKSRSYKLKTLKEAREEYHHYLNKDPELLNRQFRRFHCENVLWESLAVNRDVFINMRKLDLGGKMISTIKLFLKDKPGKIEYFIGFINAISKPFLYFKENNKKIALQFIVQLIETLCEKDILKQDAFVFDFSFSTEKIRIPFRKKEKEYEIYLLLVTLINCLATIDSTYLLYSQNIKKIIKLGNRLNQRVCSFAPSPGEKFNGFFMYTKTISNGNVNNNQKVSYGVPYLYEVLFQAIKRILSGISGKFKKRFFDNQLKNVLNEIEYGDDSIIFWRTLYLENNPEMLREETVHNIVFRKTEQVNLLEDYRIIAHKIKDQINSDAEKSNSNYRIKDLSFVYIDKQLKHSYVLNDPIKVLKENSLDRKAGLIRNSNEIQEQGLIQLGIDMSSNEDCYISVNNDLDSGSISNQRGDLINNLQNRAIYLHLSYQAINDKDSAQNMIEIMEHLIRPVLSFRYKLKERFAPDLVSNAIRNALQAEAGEGLLRSNKPMFHGGHKDIINLLRLLENTQKWFEDNSKTATELSFPELEMLISLFMDLCISTLNNKTLLNDYFNVKEGQRTTKRISPILFVNTIVLAKDVEHEACRKLLQYYFEKILTEEGIEELKRNVEGSKEKEISIQITKENLQEEQFIDLLLERMPLFMTPSNTEESSVFCSALCLIGIIDVLLRNAIEHGSGKSIDIILDLPLSSDKPLCLSIKNDIDTTKPVQGLGITWRFFEAINDMYESAKRDCQDGVNGFTVKHVEEESGRFVVKLECYKNFTEDWSKKNTMIRRRNE